MEIFAGLLNSIPGIIVLVAAITLTSKRPGAEGTMMLVGSVLNLCISLFYSVALPFLMREEGYDSITGYLGTIRVIGIAGGFLFAIGFLLFIQKITSEKK